MIIPDNEAQRTEHVKWLLDTCMESINERKELYERRRQFFLFGTRTDTENIDRKSTRLNSSH